MLKKRVWLIFIFIGLFAQSFAQVNRDNPNDFQVWLGAGLKLDLPKKWEFEIDYQLRQVNDASTYKGSYFSPQLSYKFNKYLEAFANYRWAFTVNGNSRRAGFGLQTSLKLQKWNLGLRTQLQYTEQFADDGETITDDRYLLRTRLGVKYALTKKLDIYGSTEPFFTFDNTERTIDNIRNTIGIRYEYIKNQKVNIYYIYRPDYAKKTYNRTFHVLGMNLDFELKIKGKKAKEKI
jgi:hypothetical protein